MILLRPIFLFISALFGTTAIAQENPADAWIDAMAACEELISTQSFSGFEGYTDTPSAFGVEPQLERAFQHPNGELISSAMSDGSRWFLCETRGETGSNRGAIIGSVTGSLQVQIVQNNDHAMVLEAKGTFAPIRVICREEGQVTLVAALLGDDGKFKTTALGVLPSGVKNPCR